MFLVLDSLGQGFGRVACDNRNPCLYDQRSSIKFFGDEMHRRAMLAVTSFQGAFMRMQALVFGQ